MHSARAERIGYLAVIFWIGFAALIYQLYSVRVLFLFFVENTHAVALAISSFLAGLACSSLLFSRLTHHNTRNRQLVCLMATAAGLYGYVLLGHYEWIPYWMDAMHHQVSNHLLAGALSYAIMWLYLFFPAFFLGGAFPLINGLYLRTKEESARDTGTVYFWDTFGAIAGALVAGYVLLPMLGLRPTAQIAAAINILVAIHFMPRRRFVVLTAVLLAGLIGYEVHQYRDSLPSDFIINDAGHILPAEQKDKVTARYGKVQFQKESPYGRITVGEDLDKERTLFVNYRVMCNSVDTSEIMLGREALHGSKPHSRVLNIGLGCGLTASQLAFHPNTKHLDVVEINPVIPEAAVFFADANKNVLTADNVELHIEDGAQWLRMTPTHYDAIVIDVEEVSIIYSSPLYTKEYFAIARERLTPDGVFALWSFEVSPDFSRVMYNTLKSAFPYVEIRAEGDGFIKCYAAMHPLKLPPAKKSSDAFNAKLMALTNQEVNSLEDRALERYYNSNHTFGLPDYYREKYLH